MATLSQSPSRPTASPKEAFNLKRLLDAPPSVYVIAALVLCSWWLVPALLRLPFQMVIVKQAALMGLAICAQLLVMRAKSIDLSIGGVYVLMNYLVTSSYTSGLTPVTALAVPLAAAILVGAVNGFFVAVLRASAVVVTLASGAILVGLVLLLSSGNPPGSAGTFIRYLGTGTIQKLPVAGLVWLAVVLVLELLLRRSVYGRFVRVIGSNVTAAQISGVPVVRTMFLTHVFAAALAGLGGILMAGYIGMGSVKIGSDIVMTSIAGVILGGIVFGGGRKSILGAALAAYALAFIFNLMTGLKFGEPSKLIVQGIVIFAASAIASYNLKRG